jgi:ACS family glucarate transporter-like MFS transporter
VSRELRAEPTYDGPPARDYRRMPVRFRILGVLLVMSFVNYLVRNNVSVALPSIRQEFGYTSTELGWILSSFTIAYTLFQIPGGIFGQRVGARLALTAIAVCWGVLTFLTGLVPALIAGSAAGAMAGLIVVRFLTGVTHAPVFPVMSGAIERWFPVGHWALPNALSTMGNSLGQACVGPLVTILIVTVGWRGSFYCLAPLALAIAAWWWWYGRDKPAQHRAVDAQELERITANREPEAVTTTHRRVDRRALLNRDVLLLAASYFCMNVVFYMFTDWLFTYFVEEKGFGLLASGMLYALPFLTGAVFAALGGIACDALCHRVGPRWGCRIPAMTGLLMAGVMLLAGAHAADPYVAVGLLALCFGFIQFTDSSFWSGTTFTAGSQTAAACGVLNTGGNLPGFLAPLIGWTIDHMGWLPTFAGGSAMAIVGAVLWLFIDVTRRPSAKEVRVR